MHFTFGQESGEKDCLKPMSMKMMIGTGASTNVLDKAAVQKLKQTQLINSQKTGVEYLPTAYSQLSELGKFDANMPLRWKEEHNHVFQKVKRVLTIDTVVAYLDKERHTQLTTDISHYCLHTPG